MTASRQQLWRDAAYAAAIISLAGLILYGLGRVLLPFFLSCFAAYLLTPVVEFLERRGLSRLRAVATLYGALIIALAATIIYLFPTISEQITTLRSSLPEYSTRAEEKLMGLQNELEQSFPELKRIHLAETITRNTSAYVNESLEHLPEIALNVFTLLTVFVLVPIMTWYLLLESRAIKKFVIDLVPNRHFETVLNLIYRVDQQLSGYLLGLFIDAVVVGALLAVGYSAIGVEYGVMIGAVSGFIHLIPYVGPVSGAVMALIVTLLEGGLTLKLLYVILVASGVQFFDSYLIQPAVMWRTANLRPLLILMILLIGGRVFGLWGMLLGVPVFCVCRIFVQELAGIIRRQQAGTA